MKFINQKYNQFATALGEDSLFFLSYALGRELLVSLSYIG
jgi:hypothetical protein